MMTLPCQRLSLLEAAVAQSFNAVLITDATLENGGPFIVYANPAFCSMSGYSLEALIGRSPRILQGPDTDPEVIARLRSCLREHRFFEGSTVNYRADGSDYIVEWNISPVRDDTGTVHHFVSVQQDISRRVQAEQERHLLAQALNVAFDPVFITDSRSVVVFANEAFRNQTGYSSEDIVGKTPGVLRSGVHDAAFYKRFEEMLDRKEAFRITFINRRKNGSLFHAEQSIAPLVDTGGAITHHVCISHDVTERIGREQKLIEIAHSDPLTGLYNRRAGERALTRHIDGANGSHQPFALILCDIDHFKSINDRFGHLEGDRVLTRIAEILLGQVGESDIAVRWGGEEFLVLAADCAISQAIELAERIRREVMTLVVDQAAPVTMSLGVAEFTPGEVLEDLITRADKALYQAKHDGRNRVRSAQPGIGED